MPKKLIPALWGNIILITAQVITYYVAFQEKQYVEYYDIASPELPVQFPLLYFFGVVVVLCLILFIIPLNKLKIVFRILIVVLFSWGLFITLVFISPFWVAVTIAIVCGVAWLFRPYIWLHNVFLALALVSVGAVFGFILTPWTAIVLMLVLSVYDMVAVRFGLMLWMARKLALSEALPAFVIPRDIHGWNMNLKGAEFQKLFQDEPGERGFSILGGGDIGFPLLLSASVFFVHGFASFIVMAFFSLLGLFSAYLLQLFLLKGRPIPALPPIAFMSLIGFLIVHFTR